MQDRFERVAWFGILGVSALGWIVGAWLVVTWLVPTLNALGD